MSDPSYTKIINDGLWHNNAGLVQLLGLCPLLAITTLAINGLGLGLATTLTLATTNVTVSLIRKLIRPEIRIPVFVLLIASVVTVIELGINAWFHDLYRILGIFIRYRGQLQHHRARRGLRLQAHGGPRPGGWPGHRVRLHPGPGHPRRPARAHRARHALRPGPAHVR